MLFLNSNIIDGGLPIPPRQSRYPGMEGCSIPRIFHFTIPWSIITIEKQAFGNKCQYKYICICCSIGGELILKEKGRKKGVLQ